MVQGLELSGRVVVLTVAEQGLPGVDGGPGGGSGGHTIQEDGSDLTARTNLNFAAGILATDNPGGDSTDVTVTAALIGAIPTSEKGAVSGVATLDSGGTVPQAQLPAIAITSVYVVASEAAMLALSAQEGDVAIRTDTNETYILMTEPASTLVNWQEITTPGQVSSVNGQSGTVTLDAADVGAVPTADVGAVNGVASLDGSGDVPDAQIPANIARTSQTVLHTLADAAMDMIVASGADTFVKLSAPTADGQVLRRASSALSWGAVDLADSDAVTGLLPDANIASTIARDSEVASVATDLSNHLADTADAHDASAISIVDAGGLFTATDAEGALQELADGDEIEDLAAGTDPTGVELGPFTQGGAVVSLSTNQLAPHAGRHAFGLTRNRQRAYLDVDLRTAAANTTNLTEIGRTGWTALLTGSGADISTDGAVEFVPGVVGCNTGTTNTGLAGMSPFGIFLYSYTLTDTLGFWIRMRCPTLPTTGERFDVRFGFANAFNLAPTDGIYFKFGWDTGLGAVGNYRCINQDDTSNITDGNSGVPVDTSFHTFAIEQSGSTVRFYVDGALAITQATNVPDAATSLLPGVQIIRVSTGSTERTIRVDAIDFDMPDNLANRTFPRFP